MTTGCATTSYNGRVISPDGRPQRNVTIQARKQMGFWDRFPFIYSPGGWTLQTETTTDDVGHFTLSAPTSFTELWVLTNKQSSHRLVIPRNLVSNQMEIVTENK